MSFLSSAKALVDFSDYQIYQELIKGREDNSFYKKLCLRNAAYGHGPGLHD